MTLIRQAAVLTLAAAAVTAVGHVSAQPAQPDPVAPPATADPGAQPPPVVPPPVAPPPDVAPPPAPPAEPPAPQPVVSPDAAVIDAPIAADEERELPDYDGRGDDPVTAGEVFIWVPRAIFSPLYLVSEYVLRWPIGKLVRKGVV